MFLFCKTSSVTITTALNFPQPIFAHGQIKYKQSFLVIGGQTTGSELLDTLYLYNNINGTWSIMQTRLDEKQNSVSATWVDAAKFPSCSGTKECLLELGVRYRGDDVAEKRGRMPMEECRAYCTQHAPYFFWTYFNSDPWHGCKCKSQTVG